MLNHSEKISNIIKGSFNSKEYYFLFSEEHKWSIVELENKHYGIYYYEGAIDLEDLARMDPEDVDSMAREVFVSSFSSETMKTKEALETFRALYDFLNEKKYGINKVLDDIIKLDEKDS